MPTKAKKPTPKVEILYEYGFCGERIKEDEYADDMQAVFNAVKEHPDAEFITVDVKGLSFVTYPITYVVIYRKLEGVKKVSEREIVRELKKLVDDD
jgi:hypothetical protein